MNEIIISDDKSKFPVDKAIELLHKSYWAAERAPEKIKKSIDNSIVFGAYEKDKFVGMARVITDFATTFYIADVIVDEKYRGKGRCRSKYEGTSVPVRDELAIIVFYR